MHRVKGQLRRLELIEPAELLPDSQLRARGPYSEKFRESQPFGGDAFRAHYQPVASAVNRARTALLYSGILAASGKAPGSA